MARKAVVNKEVILNLLTEGETTQSIAEKFNVSRQAIDLHRKDFIRQGLLPDQRATRTKKAAKEEEPDVLPSKEPPPTENAVSLDQQIDLIINAFDALKRLPQLEKEVETYKQNYENALREIECLKENEKKRLDQEQRWLLAQRQDNVNLAT